MTAEHSGRAHATWSASASDRLWACPGSRALSAGAPRRESHAAAWGTACHQVLEKCLRGGFDASKLIGTTEQTSYKAYPVDEEMADCAQVVIDYVNERRVTSPTWTMLVEQKFSLEALKPPFDAGGTGDVVLLNDVTGEIEIIDLKTGTGHVVEALGNKQLRTYALGAVLANPGRWRKITATIIQPRASHRDGEIRSETFDLIDLMDWTRDLLDAMQRAARPDAETVPGDHCTFCPAKLTCPAIETRVMAQAAEFFKPVSSPPAPSTMPMEKIVAVLDAADMIEDWLNAVRAHAREQAEAGVEVAAGDSRYILVEKQARRKWVDETAAVEGLRALGLPDEDIWQAPKLASPAQIDKVLGAKRKAEAKALWTSESSGVNLVRADKTKRAAVTPPALTFFKPET